MANTEKGRAENGQYIYVAWIMYGIAITLAKVSLLLQYLKILMPAQKYSRMRLITFFVMGTTTMFYFINTFFEIFACRPRQKFWNRLIDGHCFDVNIIQISVTCLNSCFDLIIPFLPQVVIWKLRMSFQNKLRISAVFLTGFL